MHRRFYQVYDVSRYLYIPAILPDLCTPVQLTCQTLKSGQTHPSSSLQQSLVPHPLHNENQDFENHVITLRPVASREACSPPPQPPLSTGGSAGRAGLVCMCKPPELRCLHLAVTMTGARSRGGLSITSKQELDRFHIWVSQARKRMGIQMWIKTLSVH